MASTTPTQGDVGAAHRAVEFAARASYGRLVAVIASRSHDVAAAEDALGDAFAAALVQWPRDGVPANPEGWLVNAARRRLADGRRREAVRDAAASDLEYLATLANAGRRNGATERTVDDAFPDRRLGLLFACAHPAVDVTVHTPLMLQAVLGFEASDIASAFLVQPASMAQRLVRAKRKLRDAGIPFEVPDRDQLPSRLTAVLEAVYAAFTAGWDAVAGGDPQRVDLADEAIWLGRLVVQALPGEAEALGLLALMLYCHARRDARTSESGAYVPLAEQDPKRWSLALIGEAERALGTAARLLRPGRFQFEAAIQSAHLAPAFGHPADWRAIVALYDALLGYAPTIGATVGRAAALGEAVGPVAALEAIDAIAPDAAHAYQPWWALRAHLLARLDRVAEAAEAFERAAGLTQSPAVRGFLLAKRAKLLG